MIKSGEFRPDGLCRLALQIRGGYTKYRGLCRKLGAALDYLNGVGLERIGAYERDLLVYATTALKSIPGVRVFGQAPHKAPVLSFLIEGVHAHDLATLLDQEGIALRSGHHCAHPLMQFYGVPGHRRACRSRFTIPSPQSIALSRCWGGCAQAAGVNCGSRDWDSIQEFIQGGTLMDEVATSGALQFRAATAADISIVVSLVETAYRGDSGRRGWTTESDLLDGQRVDPVGVGMM